MAHISKTICDICGKEIPQPHPGCDFGARLTLEHNLNADLFLSEGNKDEDGYFNLYIENVCANCTNELGNLINSYRKKKKIVISK